MKQNKNNLENDIYKLINQYGLTVTSLIAIPEFVKKLKPIKSGVWVNGQFVEDKEVI